MSRWRLGVVGGPFCSAIRPDFVLWASRFLTAGLLEEPSLRGSFPSYFMARTLQGDVRESFVTMKPVFKFKSCAFAAMLLVLSMSSNALTLGRAKGAAIVAQPLNLSISLSAAPDEDVSDLCFEADVFYGENKVEGGKVSVNGEPAVAGQTWQVRISSKLPVDEPVVTVYLRSTCGAKASRRYVLLADVASEVSTGSTVNNASAAINPPARPAQIDILPQAPASNSSAPSVGKEGVRSTPKAQVSASKSASQSTALVAKPSPSGKARLKLAPLDLSVERDPTLKATPELLSTPTEDAQKRGEAAALWRALNLTPEDVLQDAARLKSLEANIQKLSEASGQNQRQVKDLSERLQRAESERYWNPVVFGLGALILLMVGGGFWIIRRQQRAAEGDPWWRGEAGAISGPESAFKPDAEVAQGLDAVPEAISQANVSVDTAVSKVTAPPKALGVDLELDFDLPSEKAMQVSVSQDVAATPVLQSPRSSRLMGLRDFSNSLSGSLRAINTQEMLDIRQQAEFFMTLGQYEDAIELLEGHVADSVDFNPLVCLDLLKIFHTLSRKDEFDRYREEFNAVFTGQVPGYSDFLKSGEGLEAYPELCAHLVKLWPSREALDFLETCMVRQPDSAAHLEFELDAFKELLLLHAIGSRLVNALDGAPAAFSASKVAAKDVPAQATSTGPIEVALPTITQTSQEVDLELDMPDMVLVPDSPAADNLIDFDISGIAPATGKPPR